MVGPILAAMVYRWNDGKTVLDTLIPSTTNNLCQCGGHKTGLKLGQEGHSDWCPARAARLIAIDMKRQAASTK